MDSATEKTKKKKTQSINSICTSDVQIIDQMRYHNISFHNIVVIFSCHCMDFFKFDFFSSDTKYIAIYRIVAPYRDTYHITRYTPLLCTSF